MKIIFNYKNLLLGAITLISLWLILFFVRENIYNYKFLGTLALLGLSWGILIADKLFHLRLPSYMYAGYYYFLILAVFFGGILGLNDMFFWFDDFQHFLAGIFLAILGIFIIVRLDNIGYLKFIVIVLFTLFFVGFCISLWEITEFLLDHTFNLDIQKVVKTGVTNTIIDMIMGFLGALVVIILMFIDNAVYKNKYLELLIKHF